MPGRRCRTAGRTRFAILIADIDPATRVVGRGARPRRRPPPGAGVDGDRTSRSGPDGRPPSPWPGPMPRAAASSTSRPCGSSPIPSFLGTPPTRRNSSPGSRPLSPTRDRSRVITGAEEARLSFPVPPAISGRLSCPSPISLSTSAGFHRIRPWARPRRGCGPSTWAASGSPSATCDPTRRRRRRSLPLAPTPARSSPKRRLQCRSTASGTLVGLAGSVTTVTAHALGLTAYDSTRIHLATLPAG